MRTAPATSAAGPVSMQDPPNQRMTGSVGEYFGDRSRAQRPVEPSSERLGVGATEDPITIGVGHCDATAIEDPKDTHGLPTRQAFLPTFFSTFFPDALRGLRAKEREIHGHHL